MGFTKFNKKIAIILAAGIGSRLRPETYSKPKCLVDVRGKPILEYQLNALESTSVDDILIVAGYRYYDIEKYINNRNNKKNISICVNEDFSTTNNMYSLFLALSSINKDNYEYFFILNGDVIIEPKIAEAMDHASGSVIAIDKSWYFDESMKVVVRKNRIRDISKDVSPNEYSAVSIDFYGFTQRDMKNLFDLIKGEYISKGELTKWTEIAIQQALKDDSILMKPIDITGLIWWEIDNKMDVKRAEYRLKLLENVEKIKQLKLWAFDIDGTVVRGKKLINGSSELIKYLISHGKKVFFVTNNSSMPNSKHAERLSKILGIEISIDNIFSSLDYIGRKINKEWKNKKIYSLLPKESEDYLYIEYGLTFTEKNPDIVLVGFDTELTYEKLKKAVLFIENGAQFILIHPDIRCPVENGFIPDAGSIGKLIELVSSKKPVLVGGKPNPDMLYELIDEVNVNPSESCYVGDRLETDIDMAIKSNVMPILFLTGEVTFEDIWGNPKLIDMLFLGENPIFLKHFLEKH